mgnify:CR=1 FL=1
MGLVNALLRRASREPLPESGDPAVASSHPDWLVAALRADWPGQAEAVLARIKPTVDYAQLDGADLVRDAVFFKNLFFGLINNMMEWIMILWNAWI